MIDFNKTISFRISVCDEYGRPTIYRDFIIGHDISIDLSEFFDTLPSKYSAADIRGHLLVWDCSLSELEYFEGSTIIKTEPVFCLLVYGKDK